MTWLYEVLAGPQDKIMFPENTIFVLQIFRELYL